MINKENKILKKRILELEAQNNALKHELFGCLDEVEEIPYIRMIENALRESERNLSNLLMNLQGMVYRCYNDQDWTMIYVSDGVTDLTGYVPEDLIDNSKHSYASIILQEDRDYVQKNVQQALESHSFFELTYRIICADSSLKWVLEKGQGISGDDGDLFYIEGFITDITYSKQMEKKLVDSENFARSIFNGLSAHIAVVDETGAILMVNRAWRDFASENKADFSKVMEGVNYIDACRKADDNENGVKKFCRDLEDVLACRENFFEMEYPCHSPSEQRWFIARVSRFHIGESVCAIIAHENITGRRRAEEALRRSEERSRILVEKSPLGVSVVRDGRFLFLNRAGLKMFGYNDAEEITGKLISDLITPGDREFMLTRQRLRQNGHIILDSIETSGLKKDGSSFPFNIDSVRIELDDGPATLGFLQDITRRKQSEMELKRFHEELGQMVAERTEEILKLNLMVLNSQEDERQRIAKDLHDGVGQTILAAKFAMGSYFKSNERDISLRERSMTLIDMASQELREVYTGLYPSMLGELGLDATIHWCIRNYLESSGIKTDYRYEAVSVIPHDRAVNIYRVIQEVLNNIVKHSGANKVIVNVYELDGYLTIEVYDNGAGFDIEKVKSEYRGSGLFNIRRRIEQMNGSLVIESAKGSTLIKSQIPVVEK